MNLDVKVANSNSSDCIPSDLKSFFWQQWQQHRETLFRCCIKWMGGNLTDAEDALSQAMLKAWEKVQKFAGKIRNFKSWLTSLTHNLCVDIHRKFRRGANRVENIEEYAFSENLEGLLSENKSLSALENDEKNMAIRRAIENLPVRLRQTFILHFYEDLSYKEIAQQQNISYDNVCKRISQSRKIMQKELRGYFRESESEVGTNSHSSLQMSVESQSPTPEENGEKQQQIRSQDDKNVLQTETVSVESEIAKVQPFPNNNAILSCYFISPSGDRPISPSQPEVEKLKSIDSFGELDRVGTISDEKTDPRYTGQISLFSPFPAPLLISIQRSMRLKAIVGLNITDVVNVSRGSPLLSILSIFWRSLMQGVGWKGGGGAIARSWNSCARGLFDFYQELPHPEFIPGNSWIIYKLVYIVLIFIIFDTG